MKYAKTVFGATPQTEKAPGRESEQEHNNAGGVSYKLGKWGTLDRFLILGTEGGTYYVSERKLTINGANNLRACIKDDASRVIKRIVEISDDGRAPKNDSAIFALAHAASDPKTETRKLAIEAMPKVLRIGTHLFQFLENIKDIGMRGWGRGLREAVANWYKNMPPARMAEQVLKYQSRNGWSHRDAMFLARSSLGKGRKDLTAIYDYVNGLFTVDRSDGGVKFVVNPDKLHKKMERVPDPDGLPRLFEGFEMAKDCPAKKLVSLIREYRLTREMIPTEALDKPSVWEALLEHMPMTALVRNLGNMSKVKLLVDGSDAAAEIARRLTDEEQLKRGRIHPVHMLVAMRTYAQGHGFRGSNSWNVVQSIVDAMDEGFYKSFRNVEPSGKRILLALDVSGSMGGDAPGVQPLTCRDVSAAMAMVTLAVEPKVVGVIGFETSVKRLELGKRKRLDDVVKYMASRPFGGTDCSAPMTWAQGEGIKADAFIVYTDCETWAGAKHPDQALREYRKKMGVPRAKLAVVGIAATEFTIADPKDPDMMDFVGFDSSAPAAISEFIKS